VTVVVDAGPLVAAADTADPAHSDAAAALVDAAGELVIPGPVTAEVDYLLGRRLGRRSRIAFLEDLAAGRLNVVALDRRDHRKVLELEARYSDLDPGLADLSIVVVADRFSTDRVLTFDERHFRAIRPLRGGAFSLLPADP
jgi:predicted nucleic acid-binding protein